ncbi:MAG: M56 family metallopeptidase [Lachnospiraceae bacterium]|nr:M56 family metallopeptidase [Lachnospiraceae bacterium]
MSWIRDFMWVLVLTSVTGSLLMVAWLAAVYAGRRRLHIRYAYRTLRGVLAGYLIALVYLVIHRYVEHIRNEYDILSVSTPLLDKVFLLCFLLWVVGGLVLLLPQLRMWVCFRRIKKTCMAVPKEYVLLLQKLCSEMKIRRTIGLYRGYGVQSPFIIGIRTPGIYLPIRKFSPEELEMILYHELIHYKQGDTFWKPIFGLVGNIYWFSPLSRLLWREAIRWTEANCDSYCCEDKFNTKNYFALLLEMGSADAFRLNGYAPMWTEGSEELKWRVNCMKGYFKKKTNMVVVAAITIISVLSGAVSTHAASRGIKIVYQEAYLGTVEGTEEPLQDENVLPEYEGSVFDFAGMEIVEPSEEEINTLSNVGGIKWTIANKVVRYSEGFTVKAGETILVSMKIEPKDASVKVGIVKPDGKTSYVIVKKEMSHSFIAPKTGTYKVFVSNASGKTVSVNGAYIV